MKKLCVLLTVLCLLLGAVTVLPIHGEEEIYDSVIRLHVLAASNSERDQEVKLLVRDAVLKETKVWLADVKTRKEAEKILSLHLEDIKNIANATLQRAGCTERATVTLGMEEYPTREYENLAFPAGEYLSLRIGIGEAEGKNWWCVLFPPLCLSAATSKAEAEQAFLSAGLSGEQYRIITDSDSTKYKLRFKILEIVQELF